MHALEVHHLFLLFLQYLFNVQMCLSLIKEFLAQTLSSKAPLRNSDTVKDPTAGIQGQAVGEGPRPPWRLAQIVPLRGI